ncbi:MAG: hypothetical protein QM757_26580 [Paludibaculum sp.]
MSGTTRAARIYNGSDGEATRALYAELQAVGPAGVVAMNLFRAMKCSARAKVYRGGNAQGRYRDLAYERKAWSLGLLVDILARHAAQLGIRYGWKEDPATIGFEWVLYVDLPTGQVSFHSPTRGKGPDYAANWDRANMSPDRIVAFCDSLLGVAPPAEQAALV